MSLVIIKGGSGSGKSYRLYETVLSHAAAFPNQNHIILVPEQYNLYTQRKLVALSPNGGIMNIEALSFERLAYRVFDELGTSFADVLSDEGKALLLRRICQENEERLSTLASGIRRVGFIDEIKSLISELMQYDISPEKLKEMLGDEKVRGIGRAFLERMGDIALIYEAFLKSLEDKYITSEQILSLLVEVIGRSSFVKDAYVALDGYTGLTPLQRNLMKEIMPLSEKTFACITMDSNEDIYNRDPMGLFSMSRDYAKNLMDIANECGVEIEDIDSVQSPFPRYADAEALYHLQANLFRKIRIKYEGEDISEHLNICSFENIYDEISFVAKDITDRIKADPTLCYKDFAVLASDMSLYKYHIEGLFADYDVPVFIDSKESVEVHPLVKLISAVMDVFSYDFSYETVMNIIDSGFFDIDRQEADLIDNYLLACGIRFRKNFDKDFNRYIGTMDADDLVRLNDIRSRIMAPFEGVYFKKKDDVTSYTTTLYNLFSALGCGEMTEEADVRVYRSIIDYFDKMVALLGDTVVDFGDYRDILMEGLSTIKMGMLPPSLDTVLFGDMERSRVGDIRVLYMIGMSDSNIPKRSETGGLLLQSERIRLLDMDIALAPSDRQKIFMERFYVYLATSKPSENLTVTYPKVDEEGNGAKEAYFVEEIEEIFPKLEDKYFSHRDIALYHSSQKNLSSNMAGLLRDCIRSGNEIPDELSTRLAYLKKKDRRAYDMLCDAISFRHEFNPLQKAIARAMVGDTLDMSVSRLERYAGCAYSYFLQYELGLKERQSYGMELSDMGNIYHDALKKYSDSVRESKYTWFDLPEEESRRMLDEAVESAFASNEASAYIDTKREESILRRIRGTLERSVWAISSQVKEGMFEPKGFEVSIEKMSAASCVFELEDGCRMRMRGIVDRIDTYEDEDKIYIKIIDYKSGNKDIDMQEAYEGLQLQLMFYLKAVCDSEKRQSPEKRVVPAAMLYYHVDNPMVEASADKSRDELVSLIKKAFKNKGLVCSESDVIEALDKNIKEAIEEGESYTSSIIPVMINKNGSFGNKGTRVLSENEMNTLGEYAAFESVRCGNEILGGSFDVLPVRNDKKTACDYCPYHSICGFDTKLSGFRYRYVTQEKGDGNILEMMREKMQEKVEQE